MVDEKAQEKPIETLARVYEILDTLDTLSLYSDRLDSVYVHTEVGIALGLVGSLLESAKSTRQISSYGVSFWLKFCDPLPKVDESELIPREWSISQAEVDEMTGQD